MSSFGDIIHTFPALSDAATKISNLKIDWVVEESFTDMPKWHSCVNRVIPIGLRRWRKNLKETILSGEIKAFLKDLRLDSYDYIIDAQGLLKSATIAKLARGVSRCGFDFKNARESMASLFYRKRYAIDIYQPAVFVIRTLFAKTLGYSLEETEANFGIDLTYFENINLPEDLLHEKYWIFFHGTSHVNKEWPVSEWIKLAGLAVKEGYKVYVPWGNSIEYDRALAIAEHHDHVFVLPKLNINQVAHLILRAKGVIGLDTGFSHLSAAFRTPTLSIFRASDPVRVCITGSRQQYIEVKHHTSCKNAMLSKVGIYDNCSCFENIEAERVFSKMMELLRVI